MSNYTKTTDFEAKDSLPTGDSGKIIRGAEFETEFDAIATAIATKADTAGPTFTGTLTFDTISDGTISIGAFVDEDDMSSNSAVLVPTQQSVKAYVDAQVTAQDLDFQGDSGGALSIDLDSETMIIAGGTGINTSGSGNTLTISVDSSVSTITGSDTLTNKNIDADNNTISNLEVDNFKAAAIVIESEGIGSNDNDTTLPTSAAVKDYVDSQTTAQDLDFQADSGGALSIDLDSETMTFTGGTGIDTSGLGNAVTFAIDSTVATLTGSQTLTNKTLTSAVLDTGVSGTAVLDEDDMASNSATQLATQQSIKAYVDSQVAGADTLAEVLGNGNTTGGTDIAVGSGDDITFADSSKAIFGAGSDLQIYHDGSHSYVTDAGTGHLKLQGTNLKLQDVSGNNYIDCIAGSYVRLMHNASTKLETTSTGIDVTGTVTADGLTVEGNNDIQINRDGVSAVKLFFDRSGTVDGSLELGADENLTLSVADDGRAGQYIYFNNNTKRVMALADGGDISFYEDTGTTAKLFWDASAESLGIGTSSVAFAGGGAGIHVNHGSIPEIKLTNSTTGSGAGDGTALQANGNNFNIINREAGNIIFQTAAAERMRIDSSGNLLVGKTAVTLNTEGHAITPTYARFTRDSGTPVQFNRTTNDGDITIFYKDGSTVGSIGTEGGDLTIGTGTAGIKFQDATNRVFPWNTTTNTASDNTHDLGSSTVRWQDLYLSGGAYLGGTTSANLLDDYEEGSFTATLRDATSGGNASPTTKTGTYTKVGRLVTCSFTSAMNNIDTTGMTGANTLYMDLPFATNSACEDVGTLVYHSLDTGSIDASITNVVPDGVGGAVAVCQFRAYGNNTNDVALQVQDITSGTTDFVRFTYTYQTN